VISGFNTDVEWAGTLYHVQTEDKGAPHHVIMSLVYDKGTILASKRDAYDTATPERDLKERVNKQHRLICAAVKAGRVEDLKQMTAAVRNGSKKATATVAAVDAAPAAGIPAVAEIDTLPLTQPSEPLTPIAEPSEERIEQPTDDFFADLPIIELDGIEILEEEYAEVVPESIEVISELSGRSRPTHDRLGIEMLGDGKFKSGDRKTVNVMVTRGSDRKVISGSQIMIKILGSAFRPVIFHARSDENGLARVHLQVPQFTAGRAALLVRVIDDGEEVELRKIVTSHA
jgi:hypothetical protein